MTDIHLHLPPKNWRRWLLVGPSCTGKTHSARYVADAYRQRGYSVEITNGIRLSPTWFPEADLVVLDPVLRCDIDRCPCDIANVIGNGRVIAITDGDPHVIVDFVRIGFHYTHTMGVQLP